MFNHQHHPHHLNSSNDTTALRWRARLTKEAIDSAMQDDDDDYCYHDDNNNNSNNNNNNAPEKKPPVNLLVWSKSNNHRTTTAIAKNRLFDSCVALAVVSTLWSLTVTHTWFMAVTSTLQVFVAVVVYVQHRALQHRTTAVPQRHVALRTSTLQLWQQNERLYRTLAQLDPSWERFRTLQTALASHAVAMESADESHRVEALLALTTESAAVRHRLTVGLQQKVGRILLAAVVVGVGPSTEGEEDPPCTGAALERLVWQLRALAPAVQFDEGALRDALVHSDHHHDTHRTADHVSSSLSAILKLLRQLQQPTTNPAIGSSSSKSTKGIFTFDPQQLLQTSNKTQHQDDCSSNTDLFRLYDC